MSSSSPLTCLLKCSNYLSSALLRVATPKHPFSETTTLLFSQTRHLCGYETRGFVEKVKDMGILLLEGPVKDERLNLNRNYELILSIYVILVKFAKTNTNNEYFTKLIPLVKIANK